MHPTMMVALMIVATTMMMSPNCEGFIFGPKENPPPGPSAFGSFPELKIIVDDRLRSRSAAERISEKNDKGLYELDLVLSRICFINSRELRDEAFLKKHNIFSDRGVESNKKQLPEEFIQWRGTIRGNGKASDEARTFVNSTIKDSTFLSTNVEPKIEDAISSLNIKLIGTFPHDLKAVVPKEIFRAQFLDVMHRVAFDRASSEPMFNEDIEALSNSVLFKPGFFSIVLPNTKVDEYQRSLLAIAEYLKDRGIESISQDRKTSLVRHYSDFFKELGTSSIAQPGDGWRLMFDFFTAGVNTVPEVITWDIYYLANDQGLQDEIRKEINAFVGSVKYDDRMSLPRTMSFLTEVHRVRPVATLGIPHAASADGKIGGYDIKNGTLLIPNHWAMHNNDVDWKDPQVFDASRFLKRNGNDLTFDSDKASLVTPFSVGPRSCPGQGLARRTIFQTVVNLVQNYNIHFPEGPIVDVSNVQGSFTMYAPKFEVLFEPRQ